MSEQVNYHRVMVPEGQTERLLLRPLALEDAPQIQALFPHWEIVRYLKAIVPWPYPPDGAEHFVRQIALPAIARHEQWIWTLRLNTKPDQIVGQISLTDRANDHRGFWLGLPWQRQGLMREACVWANDFWFEKLGKPVLCVSKAAANRLSIRLSQAMGMRLVGTADKDYVCGRLPSELWETTAGEWRAWKTRRSNTLNSL